MRSLDLAYDIALRMYPFAAQQVNAVNDRLDKLLIAAFALVPIVPLVLFRSDQVGDQALASPFLIGAVVAGAALISAYAVGARGRALGVSPGVLTSEAWSTDDEVEFKDNFVFYADEHQRKMASTARHKRRCLYTMLACLVAQVIFLLVWMVQQVALGAAEVPAVPAVPE